MNELQRPPFLSLEQHRVLSVPIRAAIVHCLIQGDYCPSELAELLSCERPLITRHLRILEVARIIQVRHSQVDRRNRFARIALTPLPIPPYLAFSQRGLPQISTQESGVLETRATLRNTRISPTFMCIDGNELSQLAAAIWEHIYNVPAQAVGLKKRRMLRSRAPRHAHDRGIEMTFKPPVHFQGNISGTPLIVLCDQAWKFLKENPGLVPNTPTVHWSLPRAQNRLKPFDYEALIDELFIRIAQATNASSFGALCSVSEKKLGVAS